MSESDTCRTTRSLVQTILPTGISRCFAHPKVSEGGGNLAPRIYFYDDTSGPTAMVHVGGVGPHHLMPNTKS
jgi:hypothetical protein